MILIRNNEWDHEKGRPTLVLGGYENQMLVLPGTTKQKIKWLDHCYQEELNGKITYFYFKNLTKVNSDDLKGLWKDHSFVKDINNSTLLNKILQCTNLEKLSEQQNINQDGMNEYLKQSQFKIEDIKREENRLELELNFKQQDLTNNDI